MAQTLQCILVTPNEQLLDQPVTYASIPAWDGLVGIAPSRAPLLVKLGDGPLRLDFEQGGSRWFFLAGGFAQMKQNQLSLLTEEAIPVENIVPADAEQALQQALTTTATNADQVTEKQRHITRARAMIHLAAQLGGRI